VRLNLFRQKINNCRTSTSKPLKSFARRICPRVGTPQGTAPVDPALSRKAITGAPPMKGALAWLIGIPIPIIILLYLFDVF
jgi:hypothetical protein